MLWFTARSLRFMDAGRTEAPGRSEEPIRAELFSPERMEAHAESLAAAQAVADDARPTGDIPARAESNSRVLLDSYHLLAEAVRENRAVTPAAEWLLDNFHVVEDQVRELERGLTVPYCRSLPTLVNGPLAGYPRVTGLAWAVVAHSDSRFDSALLCRFVKAYQRVTVLNIRELWAVPLMLRWVLVENLRRLGVRVAAGQEDRLQADAFADELLAPGPQSEAANAEAGRTLAERKLSPAFAVQLIQRLRYQDVSLQWLNERLAGMGMDVEFMVQSEHARQSAANLTVQNIITSMRTIAAYDWPGWFEDVSVPDECLRGSAGFAAMDFTTRDRYRHALEDLAAGSGRSELEVARAVIARSSRKGGSASALEERQADPGYYLIAAGRIEFEREIGYRPPWRKRLLRSHVAHAATTYFGAIALVMLALLAWPLSASVDSGLPFGGLALLGFLGLFAASDVATILVTRLITFWIGPRHLPRLQLAQGVPENLRTFVVVPTLLTSPRAIAGQIRQIEAHYLSNPAGEVLFALLSDWTDAESETADDDTDLLNAALAGVCALNARHGATPAGEQRFHLFHRRRQWNAAQRTWMGWERKRGKLHEFNRLLRGARDTSFLVLDERPAGAPAGVRYVITLDADTRLPIDVVRRLVGTAAHPLNRPRFDPDLKRVVEGYGVFQPRITPTLPSTRESSVFQLIYTGASGLDPYAGAVSDVYQDLFGEGSFAGKGIYEVDAFEASLRGRVPDNTVLSHDLFEGSFARCGLVSDLDVFEDFPSHSEVAAVRTHRWTRGDWQLLPWIIGRRRHSVPALGRWKMADNLRRSLSPPATLAMLLASWCMPYAPHGVWIAFAVLSLTFSSLVMLVSGLLPRLAGISMKHHLRAVADDVLVAGGHAVVALTFLANQAWLMLDAILRTLYRLAISRSRMLEWVTAAQAKELAGFSIGSFMWPLRGATAIAIGTTALVLWVYPAGLAIAAPFIALWGASPIIARAVSLPQERAAVEPIEPHERDELRLAARRIWRFFENFVGSQDHWLPPDNFQETPHPVVAHRSSPTNFGLYLLSVISARDCGWIGAGDMARRLQDTLGSLESLPRFRGHFYNWYDTTDLRPLEPLYVSSVDSGNLAGHLLALAQACADQARRPLFCPEDLAGIRDAVLLLHRSLARIPDDKRTQTVGTGDLHDALRQIESLLETPPKTESAWPQRWRDLQACAAVLLDIAQTFADERGDAQAGEILAWARALQEDTNSHVRDLPLCEACIGAAGPPGGTAAFVSLAEIPGRCRARLAELRHEQEGMQPGFDARIAHLQACERGAEALLQRLAFTENAARAMFSAMDFRFLFDPDRGLFSIGYRIADNSLDTGYYDLLASEARLASLIAIAKGDISVTHWFRLGRTLTRLDNGAALVSWSGSMFEYLMPSLVMYTPRHSLLDQTCRLAVVRQIEYGGERGVPWGVSESAYSGRDRAYTYQYGAFGVPGLGLKRGLEEELVIAPYASLLASMYDTRAALANLAQLEALGCLGAFGYYEAIDFTPSRLPESGRPAVVQAYMAHHQGMSLVALDNVLHDGIMRHRFHREPVVHAAELLLQERTPREVPARGVRSEHFRTAYAKPAVPPVTRRFHSPRLHIPSSHLLSNGTYSVMITAAGAGYSKWGDLAVSRWREDATLDSWGSYLYLRDVVSGRVWSAAYQPTCVEPDAYEAVFLEDRARIERSDGTLSTSLEILVSPEDNAEIRRLSISNNGTREREIEVTSYSEVVLAPPESDNAHPAFSNLFVRTEYLAEVSGLIAMRRPRKSTDAALWAAHVVAAEAHGAIEYESDRARFLGRGRGVREPVAVIDGRPLSNTVGPVLDPVFSLRQRLRIAPGATVELAFATMAAATREEIVGLADKYHDPATYDRISSLAWTQAQVALRHLGIAPEEAHLFQYLANRVLFSDPHMRPAAEVLRRNQLSARALWRHRISGDRPIVLLRIDEMEQRAIVWQMLRAHAYWHNKHLAVDLVLLNERKASYSQDLQAFLEGMVRGSRASTDSPEHGGIFVLRGDLIDAREMELLGCAARVTISAREGSLAEQVTRMRRTRLTGEAPLRTEPAADVESPVAIEVPQLEFFNGLGGFAEDGREYVVVLGPGQRTPAPWINVIANRQFGFQVSESGAGYTWCLNSRENQLTPWSNDPVTDPCGEAFYIRDEDSGEIWSPTAAPVRIESGRYVARHGQGYSRFASGVHGIASGLLQMVAWDDPVKISSLTLENRTSRTRRICVTAYAEWVLGASRAANAPFVTTEIDPVSKAMFARNPWNHEFGGRVCFADIGGAQSGWTADRTGFLGRNGSLAWPAALAADLDGRTGAAMDPCAAMQTSFELAPGQRKRIHFLLGQGDDTAHARALVARYRATSAEECLAGVKANWEAILGKLQVRTPERAMDLMLNRWLLYQTLACRMWARAAFYQAGGAYGFRDQLQDSMALVLARPDLAREQLLRAAARQFVEGDVQHWWHPPGGRGVRTHFSDDLLWLPYAAAQYVAVSGDSDVLSEVVPFLEGPEIPQDVEDAYFEPASSTEQGTLYEHCARTLDRSMPTGAHGLPLMGTGDWNDGMNRVGHEGRGESVWLAWFLQSVIAKFAPLASRRGETQRAGRWLQHAQALKHAVEQEAWDGAWYRRAYFDDGTPLGSASQAECRIDSLAQTWGAISGAADPVRVKRALQAVDEYLVRPGDNLVLLFTPPFDRTPLDPGYIKGYLPGLRENGGQYTHAAVWCVIAHAVLGDGNRAGELFDMLNPVNHASSRAGVHAYKIEPYVVAADIYTEPPHVRRGGWSWYTGAAGWMYRAGVEWMLGIRKAGGWLQFDPCIPQSWKGFEATFRHGSARYEIQVENPSAVSRGVVEIEIDGNPVPPQSGIELRDDGAVHRVRLVMGNPGQA